MIDESQLPRIQYRVLNAIQQAKQGITAPALIEAVYGCEQDGGPLHPLLTIHRTIYSLNERLKGFRIKATKLGRGARYRLEKL